MSDQSAGLGREPSIAELSMQDSGLPELAFAWLDAVRGRVIADLWRLADPDFRVGLVQLWLVEVWDDLGASLKGDLDRDQAAALLAAETPPDHPLRDPCAWSIGQTIAEASEGIDGRLVVAGDRWIASPDLEIVRLFREADGKVDGRGRFYMEGGKPCVHQLYARRRDDGWRIAGVNWLLNPGWPPTFQDLIENV